MIKEALDFLLGFSMKSRAPLMNAGDGSGRSWLYNDTMNKYEEVDRYVKRERCVSNVESFAEMVLEEAARGNKLGELGEWMTVIFNEAGAEFHLDDRDCRTVFRYKRALSPQWLLVTSGCQVMTHREFIHWLARVRPSIREYSNVLQDFRKVTIGRGARLDSAPTLEEGKGGMVYQVEIQASSGNTKGELPTSIKFQTSYARGSQKLYDLEGDVSVDLNEDEKALEFALVVPDHTTVAEQAIADEVAWFREKVESLTELSILEDY